MSPWDRVLDATVVRSFDRGGYERHARNFVPRDMEVSLAGKVAWITGANSGIGLATARVLGRLGARTVLLCRDEA
ncbi:MAG: dehydrogenase/reductase family er 12, partial [Pseudomonadota bacterium]